MKPVSQWLLDRLSLLLQPDEREAILDCNGDVRCDGDPEPGFVAVPEDISTTGNLGWLAAPATTTCCLLAGCIRDREFDSETLEEPGHRSLGDEQENSRVVLTSALPESRRDP